MRNDTQARNALIALLPPVEAIRIRGESDFYGISKLLMEQLRWFHVPFTDASWKHGWLFPDLKYVEQLTGNRRQEKWTLVAKKEHEIFLRERGVASKAVGMPFVYAEALDSMVIKRLPNSLLVMPPHSIPTSTHDWDEDSYAAHIAAIKDDFDFVLVCLYQSCLNKGLWVNAFERYSIPWIAGARSDDKNALIRMNRIFKSFEYMTTNAIGSHIVYAAYCGCKVSISGPYAEYTQNDYQQDTLYRKCPFLLQHNLSAASEMTVREKFSMLFHPPKQAVVLEKWASEELGKENMMNVYFLIYYLGWYPHQQILVLLKKIVRKLKLNFKQAFKH